MMWLEIIEESGVRVFKQEVPVDGDDWEFELGNPVAIYPKVIRLYKAKAKFEVGRQVKIVRILDDITSKDLIGKVGTIREIDPLPNGEFNYWVDDHYMHEAELELVE